MTDSNNSPNSINSTNLYFTIITSEVLCVILFHLETCGDLAYEHFANGRVTFNASVVGGTVPLYTVATYHCNSGYKREGGSTRTCKLFGLVVYWYGLPPKCKKGI